MFVIKSAEGKERESLGMIMRALVPLLLLSLAIFLSSFELDSGIRKKEGKKKEREREREENARFMFEVYLSVTAMLGKGVFSLTI